MLKELAQARVPFDVSELQFEQTTMRAQQALAKCNGITDRIARAAATFDGGDAMFALEIFQCCVNHTISPSNKAQCLYYAARCLIETGSALAARRGGPATYREYFTLAVEYLDNASELDTENTDIVRVRDGLQHFLSTGEMPG